MQNTSKPIKLPEIWEIKQSFNQFIDMKKQNKQTNRKVLTQIRDEVSMKRIDERYQPLIINLQNGGQFNIEPFSAMIQQDIMRLFHVHKNDIITFHEMYSLMIKIISYDLMASDILTQQKNGDKEKEST